MKKSPKKKIYSTPKLVKYGDFKKLTLGIRQTRRETNSAGPNKTRTGSTN